MAFHVCPLQKSACDFLFKIIALSLKVAQLRPTLCDPMDYSHPSSSVHGVLLARILEFVAIPFSRRCSRPKDWTQVSHIAGRFFTVWATRKSPNNGRTKHVLYKECSHEWNLKVPFADEPVWRTGSEMQTQRPASGPGEKGRRDGPGEQHCRLYTPCVTRTANGELIHSTGSSARCSVRT